VHALEEERHVFQNKWLSKSVKSHGKCFCTFVPCSEWFYMPLSLFSFHGMPVPNILPLALKVKVPRSKVLSFTWYLPLLSERAVDKLLFQK